MGKRRVVVTGLGTVSPYGVGVDLLWNNLINGKSGIKTIQGLDLSKHLVHIAGQIQNVNVDDYIEPKEQRRMDRYNCRLR